MNKNTSRLAAALVLTFDTVDNLLIVLYNYSTTDVEVLLPRSTITYYYYASLYTKLRPPAQTSRPQE
jgi:hypothetical protein